MRTKGQIFQCDKEMSIEDMYYSEGGWVKTEEGVVGKSTYLRKRGYKQIKCIATTDDQTNSSNAVRR